MDLIFKQTAITVINLEANTERLINCSVNERGIVRFSDVADEAMLSNDNLLAEFPNTSLPIFYLSRDSEGVTCLSLPVSLSKLRDMQNGEADCDLYVPEMAALKVFIDTPVPTRRLRP